MIFIITHKKFDDSIVDSDHYKVLHVGRNNNYKEEYLLDFTGNNISNKNPHYCELTGQYWAWKNYKEQADSITGIVHYRRYFTTNREGFNYTYFGKRPNILSYSKITELLKDNDIILPKRVKIHRTLEQYYADNHCIEDLHEVRKSIERLSPEYVSAYDSVINSHAFYYGNMFLCKRKLFDEYSEWLFKILFDTEGRIDQNKNGDKYQARVMGFLSERLLQVWVVKNNLKIVERAVFNTEQRDPTIFKRNYWRAKNIMRRIL